MSPAATVLQVEGRAVALKAETKHAALTPDENVHSIEGRASSALTGPEVGPEGSGPDVTKRRLPQEICAHARETVRTYVPPGGFAERLLSR